jgi:hypothetical protein
VYAAIYVLRSTNVTDNWTTVILAILAITLCVPVAEALEGRRTRAAEGAVEERETVPLEWIGITRPFTDADVREMNVALGVSDVELYGAARR